MRTPEPSTKKPRRHICIACDHVAIPVTKALPGDDSVEVCAKCGSEDVFAYHTKEERAEHVRICEEDAAIKAAAKNRRDNDWDDV